MEFGDFSHDTLSQSPSSRRPPSSLPDKPLSSVHSVPTGILHIYTSKLAELTKKGGAGGGK